MLGLGKTSFNGGEEEHVLIRRCSGLSLLPIDDVCGVESRDE